MTVSASTPKIAYAYTGPGDYPFLYPVFKEEDLEVSHADSAGVNTHLVLNVDYTVELVPGVEGGTIISTYALTGGILNILRVLPITQETVWASGGPFNQEILEEDLDRVIMIVQQLDVTVKEGAITTNWRGDWEVTTQYAAQDLISNSANGNWYSALVTHTSGTDLDIDIAEGKWALALDVAAVEAERIAAEAARDAAVIAQGASETARDESVTAAEDSALAQGLSEDARDLSISARDASIIAKDLSETAQGLSETAQGLSEDARDAAALSAAKIPAAQVNKQGALIVQNTDDSTFDLLATQGTAGHPLVSGGADVTPSFTTLQDTALAFNPYRKNVIINGDFDIWQRGTSFTTGYSADRWHIGNGGTGVQTCTRQSFTIGQTDVPNNPAYYSRVSTDAATQNGFNYEQRREDVTKLSGKTATLSFWAKADSSITRSVNIQQNFGVGGSSLVYVYSGSYDLTTSWKKFVFTFDIDSISGKVVGASSFLIVRCVSTPVASGASVIDIAQVQLEEGSVATDFEYRPIGEELALCQRYFEKSYLLDVVPGTPTSVNLIALLIGGGTVARLLTFFKVVKRDTPTVVAYSDSGAIEKVNSGGTDVTASYHYRGTSSFAAGSAIPGSSLNYHYTADAEL